MATSNQRGPVLDRVVATQQNWGIQAPAPNHEMEGLIRGLSELNPSLQRYAASSMQLEQAQIEAQRAEVNALAQQQADALDMTGKSAMEFAGNPTPAQVPPALGKHYREAFSTALGQREGIKAKDQGLAAYNEAKEQPGFNVDAFLGEYRAKSLGGLEGVPILAAQVGNQVNAFEVQVRADAQRRAMLRHDETRNATVAQSFTDNLRADLPPDALFDIYTSRLLPQAESLGMSKKEAAGSLLSTLTALSTKMGGNPGVFDLFDRKGADGLSLGAHNPELANNIQAARNQAQALSDAKLKDDSQQRNFVTMTKLEQQLKDDPASITLDVIRANMGKSGPFATHDEAFAYWKRAQAAAVEKLGIQQLQSAYDNRQMWLLDPADQQKVLEANLGPHALRMAEAARQGDVATVATTAEQLMRAQSATGAKAPLQALEQFINTTVTSMPGKAPTPAFEAAAAIYKAYSTDPAFRDIYFKGDTAEVMRGYVAGLGSGDKEAAYQGAYRAVSPEGKAAAAAVAASPEFKDKLATVYKDVQGSSWWPQWAGGNGRPSNAPAVTAMAGRAVQDYYAKNPNASPEALKEFAADWTSKNFIHDTNTRIAVKVPAGSGGQLAQEALSAYSKRVTEEQRAGLSVGQADGWQVNFLPTGDTGRFQVVMQNGSAIRHIESKTLQEMQQELRSTKMFETPEEKAGIEAIFKQVRSGQVDLAFLAAHGPLLAKIRKVGVPGLGAAELGKLHTAGEAEMLARVKSIPLLALGPVDTSSLQFVRQRGARVDNKLTAQIAASFTTQAVASPGAIGASLAASLITMAEGTVLQAYPDPAKDAGNNLGMGYNLKANAATRDADLKRAGVPEDRIQDVIEGRAQLTQDQARRLLQVTLPTYTQRAQRAAEAAQPGLWNRMSPTQQAVMTDIAYSVGGADQFKKAWAAVASGDAEGFKAAVMTTYVNKQGERVNDTRRFALRAAMLAGTPQWNATVEKYGSFPSNQMDAMALK